MARYTPPETGADLRLVTRDATAPEVPAVSVHADDVDSAHAEALDLGFEIVRPLATQAWGVRRSLVRAPDGTVVHVVQHRA